MPGPEVGTTTVERVRRSCVEEGLEAALGRKEQVNRRRKKLDGQGEAHLIAVACSQPPEGRSSWTLKLLADQLVEREIVDSISTETVRRALKKRTEALAEGMLVHSPKANAEFVCAMEDVLEVYQRQFEDNEVLRCLDETSKQLVEETPHTPPGTAWGTQGLRLRIPAQRGQQPFHDVCPLEGWRRVEVTDRRTRIDWARVVKQLVDVDYSDKNRIVLVMDNLNTHHPASLCEAFEPSEARRIAERLEIHYTPKHGSWLNMAEIELGALASQCLDRRIPDQEILTQETEPWQDQRNRDAIRVDWRFTTQDARVKLKSLYPLIQ